MTPVVPANFPPPFDPADYVKRPDGPADLQIECGVAIVGAGPAGLACAIRLGQLLGDDPATLEQLGEVPIDRAREGQVGRLARALRRDREPERATRAVSEIRRSISCRRTGR